jgi:hypothetical protein
MLPPKELNPSDAAHSDMAEMTSLSAANHLQELEFRNLQLQTLVVELLDKNEQLRRALARQEQRETEG